MYRELLAGYREDPAAHCKTFDAGGFDDLIVVEGIQFHSLCEHHLIPFFGQVHFGYLPNGRMLGLSKFARIVGTLTRRLQTQEHLTHQLAETIWENVAPAGLAVEVHAEHLCMAMRGVRAPGVQTATSELRGLFQVQPELRERMNQQLTRRR